MTKLVRVFLSYAFWSIPVSIVLGFFGWFFFNLVFNLIETGLADLIGSLYLPVLGFFLGGALIFQVVVKWVNHRTAVQFSILEDDVPLLWQYKLLDEKPMAEWTTEWVHDRLKEIKSREVAQLLAEMAINEVRSKSD
jgi:hypothetical protein